MAAFSLDNQPMAPGSSSPWIRVFSRVPLALSYPFARWVAWCAWKPFPYRRHVVEGNLKASFPEWDDARRETVHSFHADAAIDMVQPAHLDTTARALCELSL